MPRVRRPLPRREAGSAHVSSPGFPVAGTDSDRSFPAELVQKIRSRLVWRNGTPLASRVVHGVTDHLLNCVCNLRVFLDDARCQCPFVLCFHPQVFLRKGVTASRSYQEQTGKSGSFGLWHHPRGYVSNFLVRPASSLGAPERSGTPSRHSRGIDTPVSIQSVIHVTDLTFPKSPRYLISKMYLAPRIWIRESSNESCLGRTFAVNSMSTFLKQYLTSV